MCLCCCAGCRACQVHVFPSVGGLLGGRHKPPGDTTLRLQHRTVLCVQCAQSPTHRRDHLYQVGDNIC